MSAHLVGWGPAGRIEVAVRDQAKIGAGPQNDVVVVAMGVSQNHAQIVRSQGAFWLEDAPSRYGTLLNGVRITRSRLRHLDVVSLARAVDLVFLDRDRGPDPMPVGERLVRLEWLDGPEPGKTCEVTPGGLTMGRADNSGVVIKSDAASRRHARVVSDKGDVTVEDLGSANGTQVNGQMIKARTPLRDGDLIQIGELRFRVRITDVSPAPPPVVEAPPPDEAPVADEVPLADQEWRTRIVWAGDLVVPMAAGINLALAVEPVVQPAADPRGVSPAKTIFVDRMPMIVPVNLEPEPPAGPAEARSSQTVFVENPNLSVPTGVGAVDAAVAGGTIFGIPPIVGGVPTSILNAAAPTGPAAAIAPSSPALTGIRLSGTLGTFTLPLGEARVGRDPGSSVRLNSQDVSRLHATITVSPEQAMVEDKGSSNGTTVNGVPQTVAYRLQEGDRLKFGDAELRVELLSELGPLIKRVAAVLMVAALWMGAATGVAGAQDADRIQGRVTDTRGTPLGRVTIVARDKSGDETPTVTGPDGTFLIGGLDPGVYEVVVENPGFAAYRTQVTLPRPSEPLNIELGYTIADFSPVTDRWRLQFPPWQRYPEETETPFVRNRGIDPYDQNVLKGDLPIAGDNLFLNLTVVSETLFEYRKLPTPSGVGSERPEANEFFGRGEQYAAVPTVLASLELFHGSTSFKPRDWAIRVTPVFNLNYAVARERGGLNVSPEEGPTRRRQYLALQEAFAEVKLADVGPNYDFVSVRAGVQPFNSDFRGFLFRDTNLGVRAFGTWGRNRNQWNAAYFDQFEKETNSDLNIFNDRRKQRVWIANMYRQDFLTEGYTISPSFHANFDEADEFFYDENGFLVRPSPIGVVRPHTVKAYYGGFGGDGHWGRLNVTHQFYQAFGTDELNGIAGREVKINAQFAAGELSVDRNWWRPRVSVIYASGDKDPADDKAQGFDAIVDNPNIAGGPFSFWVRQGLRLPTTGVGLVGRSSLLPSLRSSKVEGQANFVNPGLLLLNGGFDAELTTKLRTTINVNYLRFHRTDVLRAILFQDDIDKAIGIDSSVGFQYRPALNDNLVIAAGASIFTPGKGFKQILTDRILYTPFVAVTLTY